MPEHRRRRLDDPRRLLERKDLPPQLLLGARQQEVALDVERLHLGLQPAQRELLFEHLMLPGDPLEADRCLGVHLVLFRRHLTAEALLRVAEGLLVARKLALLDLALGRQLGEADRLLREDVRLIAPDPDLVADFGLELLAQGGIDDEDLRDLRDLDLDAPWVPALVTLGVDGRAAARHRRRR